MGTLRLVLAMSVVLGHGTAYAFLTPFSGNAAVYCFFVISGFYMSLIINGKYVGDQSAMRFYVNRLLRLFPTYFSLAVLTIIYRALVSPQQFQFLMDASIPVGNRFAVIVANMTTIGLDHLRPVIFDMGLPNTEDWRLFPQGWSLEPEIIFYVLAPFVLKGLNIGKALGLFAVGLLLFFFRDQLLSNNLWFMIPGYLVFFATGAVCYLWYKRLGPRWTGRSLAIFVGIGLTVLGASYLYHLDQVGEAMSWQYLPFYLATAVAVPFAFKATNASRVDRFLGELSYPLYLVHLLVIRAALDAKFLTREPLPTLIVVLAAIAAAIVLRLAVEIPVDRRRQRIARAAASARPVALAGANYAGTA